MGMRIGELLHLRVTDYDYPDPFEKTGNIYLIEEDRDDDDEDRQLKTGERNILFQFHFYKKLMII